MPEITEMFAFVAEERPGEEGVIGAWLGDTCYPLVGADMAHADSLRDLAEQVGQQMGVPVRLVRFTTREVIEPIWPRPTRQ